MEDCCRDGFETILKNPNGTRMKHVFLKPHKSGAVNNYLNANGITDTSVYHKNFVATSDLSQCLKDILRRQHPQAELLLDIL
jgi:hypothetical protein